jgi:hypothetical protein
MGRPRKPIRAAKTNNFVNSEEPTERAQAAKGEVALSANVDERGEPDVQPFWQISEPWISGVCQCGSNRQD